MRSPATAVCKGLQERRECCGFEAISHPDAFITKALVIEASDDRDTAPGLIF
jgi:hypothetical protein